MATGGAPVIELVGLTQFVAKVNRLTKAQSQRLPGAIRSVLEIWLTKSVRRTPRDTGALRASGHVQGPVRQGREVVGRIVFGGPSAPYARIVHEDLRAFHRIGQAKYLESVFVEEGSQLASMVAARMRGK